VYDGRQSVGGGHPNEDSPHGPAGRWIMTKVRDVSFVALAALSAMLALAGNVDAEDAPPTIVTLGDSYINSYGVAATETFATRLKAGLNAAGHQVKIVEVGYTENSRSGLRWLTKSRGGLDLQASPTNHVVIIELGQNDCGVSTLITHERTSTKF